MLLCIGEAVINGWVLRDAVDRPALRLAPGGAAIEVAAFSRILRPDRAIGVAAHVGADAMGRWLRARCTELGIDVRRMKTVTSRTTLLWVCAPPPFEIKLDRESDETPDVARIGGLRARSLHLASLPPSARAQRQIAAWARAGHAANAFVSLDLNARPGRYRRLGPRELSRSRRNLEGIAERADLIKASDEDLHLLGYDTVSSAAETLASRGATVVVTQGRRPAVALGRFGSVRFSPDAWGPGAMTLGAGDAFVACILDRLGSAPHPSAQTMRAHLAAASAFARRMMRDRAAALGIAWPPRR